MEQEIHKESETKNRSTTKTFNKPPSQLDESEVSSSSDDN